MQKHVNEIIAAKLFNFEVEISSMSCPSRILVHGVETEIQSARML